MQLSHRLIVAAGAVAVAVTSLTACSASDGALTSPSASREGQGTDMSALYDAVTASDPRVADPLATISYSGFAKTLSMSVLITGDEPVGTETLTAILVAVRDTTPDDIETVGLIAREAADEERIVDLRSAIAGLPDDVTALYDGGVTLARVDLDKL